MTSVSLARVLATVTYSSKHSLNRHILPFSAIDCTVCYRCGTVRIGNARLLRIQHYSVGPGDGPIPFFEQCSRLEAVYLVSYSACPTQLALLKLDLTNVQSGMQAVAEQCTRLGTLYCSMRTDSVTPDVALLIASQSLALTEVHVTDLNEDLINAIATYGSYLRAPGHPSFKRSRLSGLAHSCTALEVVYVTKAAREVWQAIRPGIQ